MLKYFYVDEFEKDENAFHTFLSSPASRDNMVLLAEELNKLQYFDASTIEETLRSLADRLELDAGELIHPCRVALCGQKVSPDIFQVIFLLGKIKSIERLRAVAEKP